jgi:hypothetical protein
MWIGKFAIITYLFSFVMLAVALISYTAFQEQCNVMTEPAKTNCLNATLLYPDGTATKDALNVVIGNHNVNVTANPLYQFGDFVSGIAAIGTLVTGSISGGLAYDALRGVPFFNLNDVIIEVFFRGIFTFATACLIINFLTGREL